MTEERNKLAELFAACWKDEELKARFMRDPNAVFEEFEMPVPDGMKINVVENSDTTVHITIPAPPSQMSELTDEQMASAAAGAPLTHVTHCWGVHTCPKGIQGCP